MTPIPGPLQAESLEASLTVQDLERSLAWYTTVLGFAVDRRHERDGRCFAVSLTASAVRILLVQDDGAKGADRAKGEGCSFQLSIAQDIDALAAHVKAQGVTLDLEPRTMPHGARVFRLRDPDGFRFAVSARVAP